jgi:signal transduction histidine kinase
MLQELEESYQQVQQSLLAQRRFVADASHELRTPLTTIRGNLGLLGREPPITQEDREEVLRDVISECERLMGLVNQLLALARADAGQPLRHEPVHLEPLVEEVCRQARLLSADKSIETAGEATTALGDPDAIKQVLLILVDNAMKYTPAAGRIAVKYGSANGHVKIAVSDNGPGIEPAILAHLFDRFYRADNARAGDGTGLGLAIAKALVEAQHGTISAISERGKGATFTLELQRAPAARQHTPAEQLSRA